MWNIDILQNKIRDMKEQRKIQYNLTFRKY